MDGTMTLRGMLLFTMTLLPMSSGAVPPKPGVARPDVSCQVNRAAMARNAAAWRAAPGLRMAPPSPLAPRVLVLRVQFPGTALSVTDPSSLFQQVQDFYVENSYGVFVPTFTFSPILTLPSSMATYGANCGGNVACNTDTMYDDAIAAADPAVDFSPFDHVMVYHAGVGEESSNVGTDIWSVFMPVNRTVDGQTFEGFTVVPEAEQGADALGVTCHEYGHQLGLPDLYDTGTGNSTVGAWDLMDYPWVGSPEGANPPHLGAWSKRFLGFGAVQFSTFSVVTNAVAISSTGVHEVYTNGSETFLLEYRRRSAGVYDGGLPQLAGLAIWHIDENLASSPAILNNNTVNAPSLNGGRRAVDLVEADRTPANPQNFDNGVANGWIDGQSLSSPQSDLFTGVASGLVVSNISGVGTATATASVFFLAATPNIELTQVVGFPNPAGPGRGARVGAPAGTMATIRSQFTRPVASGDLRLNLFSLDGRRVRSVDGGAFNLHEDISQDYSWIYEFDWDGKNEAGEAVSSGIYVFRLEAEGVSSTGKIAIER